MAFIRTRLGARIGPKTRFFDDAGIDGLDAETFMLDFGRELNVDLSAFRPDAYFMQEGRLLNVPRNAWDALFNRERLPHKTFTAAHRVDVANKREWSDP